MKECIGKFIKVKFKDIKSITGIVVDAGDDWLLLKNNPRDYVIDGYVVVKNKNIKGLISGDKEKWKEKVIGFKKGPPTRKVKLSLESLDKILTTLTKKYEVLSIRTKQDDARWLGRLREIDDKSVTIDHLTSKARWNGQKKFKIREIRVIEFDTHYINSLKAFLNSEGGKLQ